MEQRQLLDQLVEVARDAGLTVKRSPSGGPPSAACRVRGEVWLVLDDADPLEHRIDVVAQALRDYAGDALEERYLPPAVRARLEVRGA